MHTKHWRTVALLAVSLALPLAQSGTAAAAPAQRAAQQGDTAVYIVALRDVPADPAKVTAVAQEMTGTYGGQLRRVYHSAMQGFSVDLTMDQYIEYLSDGRIDSVTSDKTFRVAGEQKRPPSWGLDRIDQPELPLNRTYKYPNDAANVRVYVLDTGVRTSHFEFGGRARGAFDALNPSGSAGRSGQDCNGHGTQVAATIGGRFTGVAKGVRIESVRTFGCDGTGTGEQILTAIDWVDAHAQRPALLNLSFSGPAQSVIDLALYAMTEKGLAYTAASGNDNVDGCYTTPGRQTTAITVAATDRSDRRLSTANFGTCVHLFAPGEDIVTANAANNLSYTKASGTSMAAAHAAGVAAMYLAKHPEMTPVDLDKALKNAAAKDKVQDPGEDSPNFLLQTG
ncbi:S8 family peptidase [Pilimelia columellifera]|uniref:Peptidase S8/S53 domain-containing protein n=1 Tax=Pilimelia columellifera subsp. columellifera TaxID=706583 RepID=A0ABN3MVX9_9ACTN